MTYTREHVRHMMALLYQLLREVKDQGHPKASIQLGDIQSQEWAKELSSEECLQLAYYTIKWREDLHLTTDQLPPSEEHGVRGYSYTDDEGLLRLS